MIEALKKYPSSTVDLKARAASDLVPVPLAVLALSPFSAMKKASHLLEPLHIVRSTATVTLSFTRRCSSLDPKPLPHQLVPSFALWVEHLFDEWHSQGGALFTSCPLGQLYISSIASQGQFETLQLPLILCPATSIARSLLQRNLFSALYTLALEIPAAFHDLSRGVVTVGTLEERGRRFFARQGG